MAYERKMLGKEVKEVFGDGEMLKLEENERSLIDAINAMKAKLNKEWDQDLQNELQEAIKELRVIQRRLQVIDQRLGGTNEEAKPVA